MGYLPLGDSWPDCSDRRPQRNRLRGPGYAFKDEISPDLKFDKAGVVAMANAGPGSNGSQFFIAYTALPTLDGKYTIFGQVIKGMDVVQNLTAGVIPPNQGLSLPVIKLSRLR